MAMTWRTWHLGEKWVIAGHRQGIMKVPEQGVLSSVWMKFPSLSRFLMETLGVSLGSHSSCLQGLQRQARTSSFTPVNILGSPMPGRLSKCVGPRQLRTLPSHSLPFPLTPGSLPFFSPFAESHLTSPCLISIIFQNSDLRWLKVVHAHQQNLTYRSRRSLHTHTPFSACTLSSCPMSGHPSLGTQCPLLPVLFGENSFLCLVRF